MRLAVALALVLVVLAAPASAQEAVAEALFQQAKALIRDGKHAEACPKLAESQRLDPAGGTVLALALCHQATGKLASAWLRFREAVAFAKRDGRNDRLEIANARIQQIEPRLSRVEIAVDDSARRLPELRISLDETRLGEQALGVPLPIDGGEHIVRVEAKNHRTRIIRFEIASEGAKRTIPIDTLEPVPSVVSRPAAPPPPADEPAAPRPSWLSWTALGVGVAGVVAAGAFGIAAKNSNDQAKERCPSSPCADTTGVDASDRARSQATIATVSGAVGIVGLSVFALLLATEPGERKSVAIGLTPGAIQARLSYGF